MGCNTGVHSLNTSCLLMEPMRLSEAGKDWFRDNGPPLDVIIFLGKVKQENCIIQEICKRPLGLNCEG